MSIIVTLRRARDRRRLRRLIVELDRAAGCRRPVALALRPRR